MKLRWIEGCILGWIEGCILRLIEGCIKRGPFDGSNAGSARAVTGGFASTGRRVHLGMPGCKTNSLEPPVAVQLMGSRSVVGAAGAPGAAAPQRPAQQRPRRPAPGAVGGLPMAAPPQLSVASAGAAAAQSASASAMVLEALCPLSLCRDSEARRLPRSDTDGVGAPRADSSVTAG